MPLELSRNITLLLLFFGLLVLKLLDFNGIIDDMLILVIGAIIGREVINNVRTSRTTKNKETSSETG